MSFHNILKSAAVLFFSIIFLAALPDHARGQGGVFKGIITDKEGNPLNKVKIAILDPARGTKFAVSSNKKGEFIKVGIPPASYVVTFSLDGYYPYETKIGIGIEAEKEVKIALNKLPPKLDKDKDFAEGTELFKQGKYQEAIAAFQRVTEKFPQSVEAFYNLALGYLRSGDVDQAVIVLNKVLELKPDVAEAYFALGECYFRKGDMEKAKEAFTKITELQPENAQAYYNLGIAYFKFDKTDEALQAFEVSLKINPRNSSAYYQAGLVCVKRGDYPKAVRYFEEFLNLEPNAPEAGSVKAMIEQLKKRTSGAVSLL